MLKYAFGWLEPGEVMEVTDPGTYRVYALETSGDTVKTLRFDPGLLNPTSFSGNYVLEYRQPIGIDAINALIV